MTERRGETFVIESDASAVSFSTFVLGLASSVLIHLGEAPNPDTGSETAVNLVLARQSLDLLEMLRHKTSGNLTVEEEQLFKTLLTDLRLRYVQKQQGK